MEVRNAKYPAYKNIMKNNFMNQYYHSISINADEPKHVPSSKGV